MNTPLPKNAVGNILIVDDHPDDLRFLSELLIQQGYRVRRVMSGRLALEAAQLEPPDLILLDIVMPDLNGYKICYELKQSECTCHIPIVFLSALDEELDKVLAFDVGGVDYITKPFEVTEVLARVATHLKLSQLQNQLRQRNVELEQEIQFRKAVEEQLQALNQNLDAKVQAHTAELVARNEELVQLQDKLQQALTRESQLNKFQSEVLTTISHEFRTPLSVITTAVALSQQTDTPKTDREQRYLEIIADSTQRMSLVLKDALMLVELEAQRFQLNLERLDLTQFCQSFVNTWKLPEEGKYQFAFVCWGQPLQPAWVDAVLLNEVLTRLTNNAIRYSPQGGKVLFELVYEPGEIIFRIRDEGIGIPPEEQDQVFNAFYRASNANTIAGTPGAGLGLAVVKLLIEQHGGTIAVESQVDKGTQITITLPISDLPVEADLSSD